MTSLRSLPLALALSGLLCAPSAFAQLKLPGTTGAPANSRTAPAAAPDPAPDKAAPARDTSEMEKAAQLAAMGWLLLLDRKDWGTAWDTSAAMFRAAVPLANWMTGIPAAREPLGKLIERTPVQTVYKSQLEGRPAGDYVSIVFQSRFEKKPDAREVVTTTREPDGKWRVTGYSPG